MPRQTKETIELEEKDVKKKAKTSKKSTLEASSTKKSTTKKATLKADTTKTTVSKKDEKKTVAKKTSTKKTSVAKKSTTKKADATKKTTTKKTDSTKKNAIKIDEKKTVAKKAATKTSKKADAKASATKKASSKSVKNEIIEYYDLPYRYNKTIVKILAQTPKKLFVYWDISDSDRKNFIKIYGDDFFEITKPVLVIRNTTMNYSFEVEINDFANSWYLNVNDSDCKYSIELGRRPKEYNSNINTDYIYVSASNDIKAPNDCILFNDNQGMVYFRNVKTNFTTAQKLTSLSFISNMGKIYNIYDLYKKIYSDENLDELSNPSSSFM